MIALAVIIFFGLTACIGSSIAWSFIRRHRARTDWNPLGKYAAERMSLAGTMPCVDCCGDIGQCRPWCIRAGGRGDNLDGDRDPRRVDDQDHQDHQDRQVARRARRRAVQA